jgi:hypothetical protein
MTPATLLPQLRPLLEPEPLPVPKPTPIPSNPNYSGGAQTSSQRTHIGGHSDITAKLEGCLAQAGHSFGPNPQSLATKEML